MVSISILQFDECRNRLRDAHLCARLLIRVSASFPFQQILAFMDYIISLHVSAKVKLSNNEKLNRINLYVTLWNSIFKEKKSELLLLFYKL